MSGRLGLFKSIFEIETEAADGLSRLRLTRGVEGRRAPRATASPARYGCSKSVQMRARRAGSGAVCAAALEKPGTSRNIIPIG